MEIIVKALRGLEVSDELRDYAIKKVKKYEPMVEEPAICEIVFDNERGPKAGNDKRIHINLELPENKHTLHVEHVTDNFRGSIDLAQEELEQQVLRYKEEVKIGTRFPKKFEAAKIQEEENKEI